MNTPHDDRAAAAAAAADPRAAGDAAAGPDSAIAITRARIHRLLDSASFRECGSPADAPAVAGAGVVARGHLYGVGLLDGRPLVISADIDVSQHASATAAGSRSRGAPPMRALRADPEGNQSRARAEHLAVTRRVPLLRLLTADAVPAADDHRDPWGPMSATQLQVPVISVCTGEPQAGNALRMACSHLRIRVGDPAIDSAHASPTELLVPDEASAHAALRHALSCLPACAGASLPRGPRHLPPVPASHTAGSLRPVDRRQAQPVHALLESVVDPGSLQPLHGAHPGPQVGPLDDSPPHAPSQGLVAGLARIDGVPVLVLAGDDTEHAPLWNARSVARALDAVTLATRFGLTIVQLVDGPGIAAGALPAGSEALAGIAQLHAALTSASVPRCVVATRTLYRDAPGAALPRAALHLRAAWPDAWVFEREDAEHAAAREILTATALDPERLLRDLDALQAPRRAAPRALAAGWIDELVAPEVTRAYVRRFVRLAQPR